MRIAEYKQIDTKVETYKVPTYDEEGNEVGTETITKEIPVMGMIYRDATPEEEEEALRMAEENKPPYAEVVESLIRERYTISDELAILRQRDTKPEEFEAYNAYAEECKRKAKE